MHKPSWTVLYHFYNEGRITSYFAIFKFVWIRMVNRCFRSEAVLFRFVVLFSNRIPKSSIRFIESNCNLWLADKEHCCIIVVHLKRDFSSGNGSCDFWEIVELWLEFRGNGQRVIILLSNPSPPASWQWVLALTILYTFLPKSMTQMNRWCEQWLGGASLAIEQNAQSYELIHTPLTGVRGFPWPSKLLSKTGIKIR